MIFEIALPLLIATVLWQYFNKYLALFLILTVVSTFWPVYGFPSFMASKAVLYGMIWYGMTIIIIERSNIEHIYRVMRWAVFLNVIVQTLQWTDLPFWMDCKMPVGLMSNPNETSALYIFSLMAFSERKNWKLLPLVFWGIYLSDAMTGYVCLIVGIPVYIYLASEKKNVVLLYALGVVVFIALLVMSGLFSTYYSPVNERLYIKLGGKSIFSIWLYTLNYRLECWKIGFRFLKEHWILGSGIGYWKYVFERVMPTAGGTRWVTAHNEYLQTWFEMGIGAIILIGLYFIDVIRRYHKRALVPTMALILIAVNSAGNFPWHIAPLAVMALTWMAILEVKLIDNSTTTSRRIYRLLGSGVGF